MSSSFDLGLQAGLFSRQRICFADEVISFCFGWNNIDVTGGNSAEHRSYDRGCRVTAQARLFDIGNRRILGIPARRKRGKRCVVLFWRVFDGSCLAADREGRTREGLKGQIGGAFFALSYAGEPVDKGAIELIGHIELMDEPGRELDKDFVGGCVEDGFGEHR